MKVVLFEKYPCDKASNKHSINIKPIQVFHELIVSIELAFRNLKSNAGRTIFSLLGIVIGVTSVILVLSFGNGVKNFVLGQVTSFGTDIFQVEVKTPKTKHVSSENIGGMAGGAQITTLKLKDAEKVAKLPNVSSWYAGIMSQQVTSYENKKKQAFLMGVTAGVTKADEQTKIVEGQMFTEEDDNGLKQVVVLGSDIKDYYFGNASAIGKDIKIKGQIYQIVGVLQKRGITGFFSFDEIIYLPVETLQKKVMGIDYVQFAIFKVKDINKIDLSVVEAIDIMRDQHNIKNPDDDDFAVMSIVEGINILKQVFFVINLLLLALTSISLVVGGVGIMNVMYVAVTERTYEIGLRKSVGAKNAEILLQFIFEAVFLTLLGGVIGVAAGAVVSKLAETIAANFGFLLKFTITWWSVVIGFGFSAVTGIIFGYYPARKASKLSPMEALRKE